MIRVTSEVTWMAEVLDTMFDSTDAYDDAAWIREQWPERMAVEGVQAVVRWGWAEARLPVRTDVRWQPRPRRDDRTHGHQIKDPRAGFGISRLDELKPNHVASRWWPIT